MEWEAGCLMKVSSEGRRDDTEKDLRKTQTDVESALGPLQRKLLRRAGRGNHWFLQCEIRARAVCHRAEAQ